MTKNHSQLEIRGSSPPESFGNVCSTLSCPRSTYVNHDSTLYKEIIVSGLKIKQGPDRGSNQL